MAPADPPTPSGRPPRRRKAKRRPPKIDANPATRRREASIYSARATVSLPSDLHTELIRLARAWDVTFPEAMRRAAYAGLAPCFDAIEAAEMDEMDRALREFDPGAAPRSDSPADDTDGSE